VQPPYSLLQADAARDLLPIAQRDGIGVIVYSPMGSGLLAGSMTESRYESLPPDDWRKRDPRFSAAQRAHAADLVLRLSVVGERHDASLGEVAIAWHSEIPR
jgi:aryl-alcohol dehydrogenase-like predicted oxidoreductase